MKNVANLLSDILTVLFIVISCLSLGSVYLLTSMIIKHHIKTQIDPDIANSVFAVACCQIRTPKLLQRRILKFPIIARVAYYLRI